MKVDFHVHTNVSDGYHTPEHVVELALEASIRLISITDHDAIYGSDAGARRLADLFPAPIETGQCAKRPQPAPAPSHRFLSRGRAREGTGGPVAPEPRARAGVAPPAAGFSPPLALVPGVEFATSLDAEEVHVLGYFPHGAPEDLGRFLARAERARRERMEEAVRKLRQRGVPITIDDVARLSPGRSIGRAHMARALVESGRACTFSDAFRRFLAPDLGVVPPSPTRAEEICALIRGWGGISVLAHPRIAGLDRLAARLKEAGLEGLEAYGKRRRAEDQLALEALCSRLGLVKTAGSDWHGGPGAPPLAGVSVGLDKIGRFLERLQDRARPGR